MANWANPTLSSTYTNFVAEVTGRDTDVALGMDPAVTTVTNPPTNAIRWSSAAGKWQKWSGTSWNDLASSYNINVAGTLTAPAGAVGTPSVAFAGAATTGFYSPAANQVALAISGTQRLLATSAGRFSFGAGASPAAPVTVAGGGFAVQESAVNRALSFLDTAGTTTYGSVGYDSSGTTKDLYVNNAQTGGRVPIKIAGSDRVVVTETDCTFNVNPTVVTGKQLLVPNGSVTAPSIAHVEGANDTGFYFPGDGLINFASNGLLRFAMDDYGRFYGTALHNNSQLPTGATNQYIASGTYTPTITNAGNVFSYISDRCFWSRTGNVVTVSGGCSITPTGGGGISVNANLSLPIPSSLSGGATDVFGVVNCPGGTGRNQGVVGNSATNTARIYYVADVSSPAHFDFVFSYEVK